MDQPSLSRDSHVVLLLASHLGALPNNDDTSSSLGPVGWTEFATQIESSTFDSPGDLLQSNVETWPDDIWTTQANREWVKQRLSRSTRLAMELEELNNRGIWVTTHYEQSYPDHLRDTLGRHAPPFFYVAGDADNLQHHSVGFVGSRDATDTDKEYTRQLVKKVISDGYGIVSGGAKGIDITSEQTGLQAGGPVIEFPTEGLQRCLKDKQTREAVMDGRLTLASHYHPEAGWNMGAAMGRNKLIHGFGDYTIVVRSGHETGGTWEGATENLDNQWSPLLVCHHDHTPDGNQALIDNGGIPIDPTQIPEETSFTDWIQNKLQNPSSNKGDADSAPSGDNTTSDLDDHQSSLDRFS